MTVVYMGFNNGSDAIRSYDDNRFVGGVFAPNRRHTASLFLRGDSYQLQCTGTCLRGGSGMGCAPELNPVVLVPLTDKPAAEPWTCEEVLDAQPTLFSSDPLIFPVSGC